MITGRLEISAWLGNLCGHKFMAGDEYRQELRCFIADKEVFNVLAADIAINAGGRPRETFECDVEFYLRCEPSRETIKSKAELRACAAKIFWYMTRRHSGERPPPDAGVKIEVQLAGKDGKTATITRRDRRGHYASVKARKGSVSDEQA